MKKIMDIPDEMTLADYYDQSLFDEKFEVDVKNDTSKSCYHMENKYYVPVLEGSYSTVYEYWCDYMVPKDDTGFKDYMNPNTIMQRMEEASRRGCLTYECQTRMVDGSYRYVEYVGIAFKENGVPEDKVYFYVFDIQNKKDRLSGKLTADYYISKRNAITGLMDGVAFIEAAKNYYDKDKGPWCCLAIDIQHFKVFGAWFGQEKSNYVLARIGALLRDLELGERATAAYHGQDSFSVFMRFDKDKIERLLKDIKEIVYTFSNSVGFRPAIGVIVIDDEDDVPIDIYDKARIAVEEAKKSYVNNILYFNINELRDKHTDYALLSKFNDSLKNGDIFFELHPQCLIQNGKIVGAEALVRWRIGNEIIKPSVFIPVLENGGFITELDKYVWEEVVKYQRHLIDKNIIPLPISINVSKIDILSIDVASYLYVLCEHYRVSSKYIKVELTESSYAQDINHVSQTIEKLREKGFQVLLDDFGSGYSSLYLLDKINVEALKLDMGFMKEGLSSNRRGVSIVESVVSMAKSLEIPIIVEGVESADQASFLSDLGCKYVQGYYFYRPLGLVEFEAYLNDDTRVERSSIKVSPTELFRASEFLNENMFTDVMLNNILGSVAFYELVGDDLSIIRFNEPFYKSIADDLMESRLRNIQKYIVKEDWPTLYKSLADAQKNVVKGSTCELRFYKSNDSVFYFHMKFFFLKDDGVKKIFYGQVEDVSERREQSLRFMEVLRMQSQSAMRINLDRGTIQYITKGSTLYDLNLKAISLDLSIKQTAENRIPDEVNRKAFIDFFDAGRLKDAYSKAIYHEELEIPFKWHGVMERVNLSSYYIRYTKDEDLIVYVFAKILK